MEKRRLGKTGHMSSILTIGGAAIGAVTQTEADAAITMAMEHGINHIDVAPTYGDAELRIGPWMPKHRNDFFLGCKTLQKCCKLQKKVPGIPGIGLSASNPTLIKILAPIGRITIPNF